MTFRTVLKYFQTYPAYEIRRVRSTDARFVYQYRYALYLDKEDKGVVSIERFASQDDAVKAVDKRISTINSLTRK